MSAPVKLLRGNRSAHDATDIDDGTMHIDYIECDGNPVQGKQSTSRKAAIS